MTTAGTDTTLTLSAELERAMLAEIDGFLKAWVAAHPGRSVLDALRDLARVQIAVMVAASKAQVKAVAPDPLDRIATDHGILSRIVRPIFLRATHEAAAALAKAATPKAVRR